MSGCPRTFCPGCDEEMIHRDNRRAYESASALGQIVWRDGPRTFTVGDVDLYVLKLLGNIALLRYVEHKQTSARIKPMQAQALRLIDRCIAHVTTCPEAAGLRLHPESGVYLIRGAIEADKTPPRKTKLAGPQELWNPRTGFYTLKSQEEVFDWMNAAKMLGGAA